MACQDDMAMRYNPADVTVTCEGILLLSLYNIQLYIYISSYLSFYLTRSYWIKASSLVFKSRFMVFHKITLFLQNSLRHVQSRVGTGKVCVQPAKNVLFLICIMNVEKQDQKGLVFGPWRKKGMSRDVGNVWTYEKWNVFRYNIP